MTFAYKLGKAPARHDPRTLKLAAYLNAPALPTPPEAHDWTAGMPDDFGMLGNDTLGDCAEAMAAHEIEVETFAVTEHESDALFTDKDVEGVYSAITGYSPGTPSTDRGTVLLDLLNYERAAGFCGHKIWAYAALMSGGEAPTADRIKLACWLFGPLSTGVLLLQSDLDTFDSADAWDIMADESPVVGGHAVPIVAYDATGVTVVSWRRRKRATWAWLRARIDECYARLGGDWFRVGTIATAPNGLLVADLQRDLNEVST